MRRGVVASGLVLLLFTAACSDEALPVSPNAAAGAAGASSNSAPVLAGIDLLNQGDRFVSLTARATDSQNRPLTFQWSVSGGNLSSTSGRAVLWRVPTEAGTYTASLEVGNGTGATVSGTQTFTVNPQGQVTTQGQVNVRPATLGVRQAATTLGASFAVPSPLRVAPAGTNVVQLNPFATPPSPSPVLPPIFQPVAPAPAPIAPVIVPLQPIAPSTPTPPPVALPPSPIPSPSPPIAEPGVPLRPLEEWRLYRDPSRNLNPLNLLYSALDVPGARRAWFATGNQVALYERTGAEEPVLQSRGNGLPDLFKITRIKFISDTTGFVCGTSGGVYRTTDAGLNWVNVSPQSAGFVDRFMALVVANANVVTVMDSQGKGWRTENASAGNPSWVPLPSFPPDRPQDHPFSILDGAGFRGDPSLVYFVGNAVFRFDADAPQEQDRWRRVLGLRPMEYQPFVDPEGRLDYGDGSAVRVRAASDTEVWVATEAGALYRISNAQAGSISPLRFHPGRFRNREANAPGAVFFPTGIGLNGLSVVDPQNIFLSHFGILDSKDGGQSWRAYPGFGHTVWNLQVNYSDEPGEDPRSFRGWALTTGGLYQLKIYNQR